MKKNLGLSFLIVTMVLAGNLLFVGCQEENNEQVEATTPLLATQSSYREDGILQESEAYRYDTMGRLIEMTNSGGRKAVLDYSPSEVTVKEYEEDKLVYFAVYTLNSQSLSISSLSDDNETATYTYDANKYRQSTVEMDDNITYTQIFTVLNGNYVSIAYQDKNTDQQSSLVKKHNLLEKFHLMRAAHRETGSQNILKSATVEEDNYRIDFEFYTDQVNTIDMENMGILFLGKQNKNPVKQETETSDNWPAHTSTYSYEYDSKGRITKRIYASGGYDVFTYVE